MNELAIDNVVVGDEEKLTNRHQVEIMSFSISKLPFAAVFASVCAFARIILVIRSDLRTRRELWYADVRASRYCHCVLDFLWRRHLEHSVKPRNRQDVLDQSADVH
jgi:hypothetical protein